MKHKGFSLVEVVVSIFVMAVSLAAILTCYIVSVNGYKKEREYLYFESICYDINAYYDKLGQNWDKEYFKINNNNNIHYYDASFNEVTDVKARYKLTYEYINNELFVTILNQEDNYNVIDNLNYGVSLYA